MGRRRRNHSAAFKAKAAAALAPLVLASCGGGGGSAPPPEPPRAVEISLSPASATLSFIGETATFTAAVLDQRGERFAGTVSWSGSDTSVFTVDANGGVTAAGNGSGTLTASVGALSTTAAVTVEQAAAAVEPVSGGGQKALFGTALPEPIVVRVVDAGGAPIEGATVTFTPAAGDGSANPASAQTGADGQAATTWTLGNVIGALTLTASVPNGPGTNVGAEALLPRPQIFTSVLPDAYADIAYSQRLLAGGGAGGEYSWALARGDLPTGLTLTATGEITGVSRAAGTLEFAVQVTDRAGGTATASLRLRVCAAPLNLRLGEVRTFAPTSASNCGFAIRAAEAGAYYRVTFVGRRHTTFPEGDPVAVEVTGSVGSAPGPAAAAPPFVPASQADRAGRAEQPSGGLHLEQLARNRRLLSWISARGGPLPFAANGDAAPQEGPPPDSRTFKRGSPGTREDNCTLNESRAGELMAFDNSIAVYAEPGITPPLDTSHAQLLADYFDDFGKPVIDRYFGGTSDVDGDGRITVFIDSRIEGPLAIVWLGDLLSTDDCEASNQAELMRLNPDWVRASRIQRIVGTVVHEAKHISSNYQWMLRAAADGGGPLTVFDDEHPLWIEEGTAEIAREMSSRLAWEAIGGPSPQQMVTGAVLSMHDLTTPSTHGVYLVLSRAMRALSGSPNSITASPDVYGAGWHFHRFLGDWLGGAATSRLGDAQIFLDLNDSGTPGGLEGIERVTGRSFAELIAAYAAAVSLAGTSSPALGGAPGFTTYDFTGTNRPPFFERTGRFPWPVTTTGSGREAVLWASLGASTWLPGLLGPNGVRIHDFRADRAGETGVFRLEAPADVRALVLRIPDQSPVAGGGEG